MQRQVEAEKRRQEAEERRLAKEAEEMSRLKAEMDALNMASKVQDSRVAAAGLKAKMLANKSKTVMARHQAIKSESFCRFSGADYRIQSIVLA